ncbi:MAG: hypothetical protein AB4042_10975 [Leptolyngbyaceae cyanobacterium]
MSKLTYLLLGLSLGILTQHKALALDPLFRSQMDTQPLSERFLGLKQPSLIATPLMAESSTSMASVLAALPTPEERSRPINVPLVPDMFLPSYPSFDSQLLDQQIVLYSLHLLLSGPPDILIVGSSRAIQGVDPDTLRRSLVAKGHPEYSIYNFSINGATAQVIDLLLRRILTPEQLPKLVIWADGSRAFNSGRLDRTYEQILSSEGFQQIENAMHPILYRASESKVEQCRDILPSYFPITAQTSPIGTISPMTTSHADGMAQHHFAISIADPWAELTAFKRANPAAPLKQIPLTSPCSRLRSLQSEEQLPTNHAVNHFSTRGTGTNDDDWILLETFKSIPTFALNASGFLENFTEFDPATYYKTFPYVAGAYDSNYVPFALEGEQTEAMLRVNSHLNQHRVSLVVVNLPLSQTYLDVTRTHYESIFIDHMRRYSSRTGFTFVDLNQPHLAQDRYFADPSHLNIVGARAVAQQIALQPVITWPTLDLAQPN